VHERKINQQDIPALSIEQLRSYEGFEAFSDLEAEEVVASILQLTLIIFNDYN
jgi:hypothetical protein